MKNLHITAVLGGFVCGVALLSACGQNSDGAEAVGSNGTSEFALSTYSAFVASLNPVGWWRLGETSGSTAVDSSSKGHNGTFVNSPTLGQTGAIVGDTNKAIGVVATSSQYVEIADHDDFSLVKAQDAFGRTVTKGSSWGTSDHGGNWSAAFSTSSYYACNGSVATIDETTAAATWGQTLAVTRKDVDLQVRGSWSVAAVGGTTAPLELMARFVDTNNFYRAELRENVGGQLDLRINKTVSGTSTVLQTVTNIGTYSVGAWWYLRFQVEGSNLRARAWASSSSEPTTWTIALTDTALTAAGGAGIRSSNSGTTTRPTVSFDDFRVQSVGMTVHAWMRPDILDFTGQGTSPDYYVHWLGKGSSAEYEWGFRFYTHGSTSRPNRISAYHWNADGSLGSGAYFQDTLVAGAWLDIVAVFDPGDALDTTAGVSIYKKGTLRQGPPSSAVLYSTYSVTPSNGTAPLRLGTRDSGSFLTGGLDEVQIYDRRLTATEIGNLYTYSQ